jgi:hypothetical protein
VLEVPVGVPVNVLVVFDVSVVEVFVVPVIVVALVLV